MKPVLIKLRINLLLLLVVMTPSLWAVEANAGEWIADLATGCRVWNPNPSPGESIKWTGSCSNNVATGKGALQWYLNGVPGVRSEGDYVDGELTGYGERTQESGKVQRGIWDAHELVQACTTDDACAKMKSEMHTFTVAVRSVPPSDKLDISNLMAQVVWGRKRDHNLVAHYDPQSQLYWALPIGVNPKSSMTDKELMSSFYKEAGDAKTNVETKIFVARLIVDGQAGWMLPSFYEDVQKSDRRYSMAISDVVWLRSRDKATFNKNWNDRLERESCAGPTYSSYKCACSFRDRNRFVPVRKRSSYDEIIESANKSSDEKLSEITASLVTNKLTINLPELKAPTTPQPIMANRLDKGEFETTEAFQKRTDAENERVGRANDAEQRNYDAGLKKHEEAVAAQQRELAAMTKHNQEPEVVRAAFVVALSEAMTMLYGDPVLVDFKYDADKQTFSGTLKSEKGGFNRAVEFAVPLSKAAQVKAQLTDTSLIPQITFKAKGTELAFAKLDIIDNAIKQQQEFALAKSTNTIEAYEKFLKQNPDSPQSVQAKQSISALQAAAKAAAERERLAAIKYAQQRQREAAAQARAEAAQYGKRKHAGDRVCLNGSAAFGLVHFKVTGYVEQVSGNRIQIRISDTEGQSARYNNVDLYQNTVLWDNFNQWRACD